MVYIPGQMSRSSKRCPTLKSSAGKQRRSRDPFGPSYSKIALRERRERGASRAPRKNKTGASESAPRGGYDTRLVLIFIERRLRGIRLSRATSGGRLTPPGDPSGHRRDVLYREDACGAAHASHVSSGSYTDPPAKRGDDECKGVSEGGDYFFLIPALGDSSAARPLTRARCK
jgi:hypothetical protein